MTNNPPPVQVAGELPKRPASLPGETYKIKPPNADHALYMTINHIVRRDGRRRYRVPYELFFNSKNMEHFQWTVAVSRVCSGLFRKGGDVGFICDELKDIYDPQGGYWRGGAAGYCNSLMQEVGETLEAHLIKIGYMQPKKEDPTPEPTSPAPRP